MCALEFATVDVAVAFLKDEFGAKILPFLKREELLTLAVCVFCFALGIPHITKVQQETPFTSLRNILEDMWQQVHHL